MTGHSGVLGRGKCASRILDLYIPTWILSEAALIGVRAASSSPMFMLCLSRETIPGKDTLPGRRHLDLQRRARRSARPTDELIQLYALECFLDRLARSKYAEDFVLKGGVLLAALEARRPTRDIDLATHVLENNAARALAVVREIARISVDDGLVFDADHATAEVIREEDNYSGIRAARCRELRFACAWTST
jgi:Nucleotidyl transferase AbiEii toxin, Type IV TA system